MSPKIDEKLQIQERKPPVVSQQCVVYQFKCHLCDTDYIGYTTRHLHQRIEEQSHCRWCTCERMPRNFKPRSSEVVLRFKEMQGKARLPNPRNAFHP